MILLHPGEDQSRFFWPAALSAGLLAFSGPFWFHSLVAEVYTLHSFFISLILLLFLLWREKDDMRYLYSAALVYGLSSGNHATMAFLLPAILVLYFCWNRENAARNLLTAVFFFLIGLSVYSYLPIRSLAEPSMDWGNTETLKGFLYHVTDRKDADVHFSYFRDSAPGVDAASPWASAASVPAKLGNVVRGFLSDISTHLTFLAALGFLAGAGLCWRLNRPFFYFTFLIVAVNAVFFVGWRKESYFPSYIVVCLFTALAFYTFLVKRGRSAPLGEERESGNMANDSLTGMFSFDWRRLVLIGVACVIPFNAVKNYAKTDRSGLYFGESLLKRVALSLENRSVFITGASWFNYYYYNDVMRLRDDVTAVKAWDFMGREAPSLLTPRRYPDLDLPDPSSHVFNSRAGSLGYVQDFLERNESRRPILMDQNLTFFEQFPLEEDFKPYRNLLLKYRPGSSGDAGESVSIQALEEFKDFMEEEIKKPGIHQTEWINKISFYIPSFAAHFHQTGRFAEERKVLSIMYEFLGRRGPQWWFKQLDNLLLDGKTERAAKEFAIMEMRFPNRHETQLIGGLLKRAEGKSEDSIIRLRKAVALNPGAFRPRLELAGTLKMMGRAEQAARELNAAGKTIRNLRELKRMQQALNS